MHDMHVVSEVLNKFEKLKECLRVYRRVAVAFSGGIDSSLLLFAAYQALGDDNVYAIHARSVLNQEREPIEKRFCELFGGGKRLLVVETEPLSWPEFVKNDSKRCYFCKKNTYSDFLNTLKFEEDGVQLLDGTNYDDLNDVRPGLVALSELKIRSPLAECTLKKSEIRVLGQYFKLKNYGLPSNSCFATRIPEMVMITEVLLQRVNDVETELNKYGFIGSRARLEGDDVVLELREEDMLKISHKYKDIRSSLLAEGFGFRRVLLSLVGRK